MGDVIAAVRPAVATPEEFKEGMRSVAGAVCILTVRHGAQWAGMTATAVMSISAEPPRLAVCINRRVRAHELLAEGAYLCVNVLDASQQDEARRFAGMVDGVRGDERFASGKWIHCEDGAPALANALVNFQCTVGERVPASTHSIVLCDVVRVESGRIATPGNQQPLIYFDGNFTSVADI